MITREKVGRVFFSAVLAVVLAPAVVRADQGSTCSTAAGVALPSSTSAAIDWSGDWDFFRVFVPQSGELRAETYGSTDTFGYLVSASCGTITYNDDISSYNRNFLIRHSVTRGTYYIAVRHYSSYGTGSYTLKVELKAGDDHGDSNQTATRIGVSDTVSGVINYAGDWDWFRIEVPYSMTLHIWTSGDLDTYGYLIDSYGRTIAKNDDRAYPTYLNFFIKASVSSGTHYIAVRHYSRYATGAYTLHVMPN